MSSCCTAWRSSRDLLVTRSSSPWIWVLTLLGPSSRMILVIFLAFSWRDALLEGDVEAVLLARQPRPGLGDVEVLERDLALDEPGLKTSRTALAALLGVGLDLDDLAGELDGGADVLEVVARRDLLGGAVDGVGDLLLVELADDVERASAMVASFLGPSRAVAGVGRLPVSIRGCPCYPSMRTRQVARAANGSGL